MSTASDIRVLVVDDSAVIRKLLTEILGRASGIEIVGTAVDPYAARRKILELKPDVVTLDIEMPRMDGLTFLQKLMRYAPTPTVIVSSLAQKGSDNALRALDAGAVSVIEKPVLRHAEGLSAMGDTLAAEVKAASQAKLKALARTPATSVKPTESSPARPVALGKTTHKILAIASSTGGTEALKALLPQLPPDIPGAIVAQHMPAAFTEPFAKRLDELCSFTVRQAKEGDRLWPGTLLITPGDYHAEVYREGGEYVVTLNQKPPVHGVRPAADILMGSVAECARMNAVGVVLTGMGRDGTEGLKRMKEAGSFNIGQNEDTCVVYGMPKSAKEAGALHKELPLEQIAGEIIKQFSSSRQNRSPDKAAS